MVEVASVSVRVEEKGAKQTAKALDNVAQSGERASTSAKNLNSNVVPLRGAFRSVRGSASQLGMQLQDVAVQAQMGTNNLIILGQQGSQIASLFGPGGALLGAFIAIGAAIVNVSSGVSETTGTLEERINDLKDSFDNLTPAQQAYLESLRQARIKQKADEIADLKQELRLSAEAAQLVAAGLAEVAFATVLGSEAIAEKNARIDTLTTEMRILKGEIKEVAEETEAETRAIEGTIESMRDRYLSLVLTTAQYAELKARQEDATDAEVAQAVALALAIERQQQLIADMKEREAQTARQEAADEAAAEALARRLQREAEAEQARIQSLKDRAQATYESFLSEEQQLNLWKQREEQIILEAGVRVNERLIALNNEYFQRRNELNKTSLDQYLADTEARVMDSTSLIAGVFQQLELSMGTAFERAVFDASSLQEAFAGVADAIGRGAVNALGQFIAQYTINALLQKTVDKTNLMGSAMAQSLNAVAMQKMAALSAFSSTAAIPIVGPAAAPAAAAAALAATTPLVAGVVSASTAAVGARALGGQVRPGESYLVGERGPELLTMGNANGRVTTNQAMGGGMSLVYSPTVNISGGATEQDRALFTAQLRQQKAEIADLLARRRF
jgi:hypothetical protein